MPGQGQMGQKIWGHTSTGPVLPPLQSRGGGSDSGHPTGPELMTLGSASSSAVTLLRATQSPVLWEAVGVCLGAAPESRASGLDQALGTDAYPDLGDMEGAEVALGQGGPWVSSSWARNPGHLLVLCSPGTCSRPGQHGCEDRGWPSHCPLGLSAQSGGSMWCMAWGLAPGCREAP